MSFIKKQLLIFIIGLLILPPLYAENLSIPFSINETAGITSTQIPVTFAQPFVKGDVTRQNTLKILSKDSSPLTIQVDNKACYPDGSLKHAVISFILPELTSNETQAFTITTDTAQTITANASVLTDILSNPFYLTVTINENNELYQSGLKHALKNALKKIWLNGPLCQEWHVTGEFVNDQGIIHNHLSPLFYLRAYTNSNIIRVSVIIENNYTYQPNPRNFVYDINIFTDDNTLFSKSNLTHYHHARLRKVFYLDITNADLDVTNRMNACHVSHDIRYLMQTKAVPSYDPVLINNLSENSIQTMINAWDSVDKLMNNGLVYYLMNSAAKGPLPQWTSAYLLTMNPDLKNITLGHGELAGSWPVHFRDKHTRLPVSIVDYPFVSTIWTVQDTYNAETRRYENPAPCNEGFDCSCNLKFAYDSLAYVPYLLTGDYYFLEELQFNANYGLIVQNPGYRENDKGLIKGIFGLQGQSWGLRTLEYCAYITPDNHPLKQYFNDIIHNIIDDFNESREEKKDYSFGWFSLSSDSKYAQAVVESDEDAYFTWSVGNLMKLGFDDIQSFHEWKSQFVISRMTNPTYCWTFSALPQIVVGQNKYDTHSYFSSMDQSWQPTLALKYGDTTASNMMNLTCNSSEMMTWVNLSVDEMPHIFEDQVLSDDYAARMQIAMATAVDAGITGSVDAWHDFHNRMIQPGFSEDARPNFALVPFSMHYARPGIRTKEVSTLPFMVEGETSRTIGISLQAMPTQAVDINFISDSQVDISPTNLTFTPDNYNVYQWIQIIPIDNTAPEAFYQGQVNAVVESEDQSYSNISMSSIPYSLYDNDVPRTLAISLPDIDFGDLGRGDSDSKSLSFTNNCDVPVTVSAIDITGNHFSMQHTCDQMLYPTESCTLTISYSTTTIGSDQGLLTLFSNATPSIYTIPIAGTTHTRMIRVGPTREYQWVRQASEIAQDNDIIEIDAGLYPGDIASWEANNLIIRGIGGRAHLDASGRSAEGKAIWVIRGENTIVENIEFSNCAVEDRNGAGIRLEGNNLILRNCYFHHNENGILTAIGLDDCELLIEGCEFAWNGNGNGLTHNMYINVMKRFTLRHSYSHHTLIGHNVKTRAYENYILYNRIMDEKIGQSSYLIDFSQGGKNIVMGNVLLQGRYAENNTMISHNAEFPFHANQQLYLVNNTFVNQKERNAIFVRVYNPAQKVVTANNLFVGDADIFWPDDLDHIQSLEQQSNVVIPDINDAGFVDPDHFDYHLASSSSPACNTGTTLTGFDIDLIPKYQYAHPLQRYTRTTDHIIDAGAFEYTHPVITWTQSNHTTEIVENIVSDSYTIVIHRAPSAPVALTLISSQPELIISPNRMTFAAGESSITKVIQISGFSGMTDGIAWISHDMTSSDQYFHHYHLPDLKVMIHRDPSKAGLYISETSIDFGIYKHTDASVFETIAIANQEDFSQTVSDISIESLSYHFSHNCPSVLHPNDYCFLNIEYSPASIGSYTGLLTISTPMSHQQVLLNGRSVHADDVLHVGKHRKYKTPRDASFFAQEGDLIEIDAGLYLNNVAQWKTNNIAIRGVNGMAHIQIIDGAVSYDGKAVWVVSANNIHIENIEISGCKVVDTNGAAIRVEGYNLWLKQCYFHHNENGILTNSFLPGATLVFENCHFAYNGYGDGYTHNMYINKIEHFIMKNCYSHNAHIGHNVKSRAINNTILYNRIMDESQGDSSYLIDFPYGGNNVVIGNVFHQGKNAENPTMLTHAPERALNNEKQRLIVAYNTFVNERDGETICLKLYDRADQIVFDNNLVVGVKHMILSSDMPVATTISMANNITAYTTSLMNPQVYDYHLKQSSEAVDQGISGKFMPYFHYVHPSLTGKREVNNIPDAGAFEYQADLLFISADHHFQITETDAPRCYNLALAAVPLSPVTVGISSSVTDIQLQPASLVFDASNYSVAQQVCIHLTDNDISENQRIATLMHTIVSIDPAYHQLQIADRTILIKDNDPELILSRKHLDFGEQLLNEQSISKRISIDNKGFGDLIIDSVQYNSSIVSLTHSCYTVAVGESCQLSVSITPDQTGIIAESINIQSNDRRSSVAIDILATGIESDTLSSVVSIGFEDYQGEHQFNMPVTFGQVFKEGDVTENKTLAAFSKDMRPIPIQVDRKATYPDGSLKHAVISCIFSEFFADEKNRMTLYTKPLAKDEQKSLTLDDLLATDFDALVCVVLNHKRYQLSARELLSHSSDIKKWLAGPVCTEWHVSSKLLDMDQQVHPHLAVHFYIRAYVVDETIVNFRVTTILENNWTFEYGPRKFIYDVSISVNGHTYEKKALTHFHHSRWKKDLWYHKVNDINLKPDVRYLINTKAIPNYDKTAINTIDETILKDMESEWDEIKTYETESDSYAIRTSDPMSPGFAHPNFFTRGGAGWRDLGLLPRWTLRYLFSLDPRAEKVMMGTGHLAGSFPLHYRDQETNLPVSIVDHPFSSIQQGDKSFDYHENISKKPAECVASKDCETPYDVGFPGMPSLSYVPYLLTGDYYYLEELQFMASYSLIQRNHGYRSFEKGIFDSYSNGIFEHSYPLRTLGRTAFITPDNHPLKHYFVEKIQDNLDFYNEKYTFGKIYPEGQSNAFGYIPSMYRDPIVSAPGDDIFTTVISHLNNLGFSDAFPLLKWKAKFTVDRMTHPEYCWKFASLWSIKIGLFHHCPETYYHFYNDIYLASLQENYAPDLGNYLYSLSCDTHDIETALNMEPDQMAGYTNPHSAITCLQPALASAVDAGITDATAAWNRYMTRSAQADYFSEAYHNNNIYPMTTAAPEQTYTNIIIDNTDPGFSTTGIWSDSNVQGAYNDHSLYTTRKHYTGYNNSSASWEARLVPGAYDIFAWWTSTTSRNDQVPYIVHAKENVTVYVNQQQHAGQWNYLGRYIFDQEKAVVEVNAEIDDKTTSADAIWFSKPFIHIEPSQHTFTLFSGKSITYTIVLEKEVQSPVIINILSDDTVHASPKLLTFTTQTPQTVRLTAGTFNDYSTTATIHHTISTTDPTYANQQLNDITVFAYTVATTCQYGIQITPVVLNFSPQVPETMSPYQNVRIENTGNCALNAKDITLTGNDFEMINHCQVELASGESCDISIRSVPINGYGILEYLRIEHNDFSYDMPVTGYGDIPIERPVISVGSGKDYQTVADALSHADHGTIIEIDAGTYFEDVSTVSFDDLTIRGIGGKAHLDAGSTSAEGKAIFVIKGNNTILENLEFSNCRVRDKNGAGIRHEGLKLTLKNCYFHDNDNGILTTASQPDGEIYIYGCIFEHNGHGDGYSHNMYINHFKKFVISHSWTHLTTIGHNIKSRAAENHILYNRIMDEDTGDASYQINLPNGGKNYIIGNIIQQGINAENPCLISQGCEGASNEFQELYVVHNTMVNDLNTDISTFVRVVGANTVELFNNLFVGKGTVLDGVGNLSGNLHLTDQSPLFVDYAAYDYHLNEGSPAINAGDASILSNTELMPASEYAHPITLTTRMKIGAPDVGAYEASSTIPPEIGVIADQQTLEDKAISAIGFTITDLDNDAEDLIVQGSSSNISLVANSNISFAGIGADRYISITPTVNENGVLTITVFVTDGSFTSTTSFNLTVTAVNDAPEISTIDDHSISEDACLTGVNFTVSDIESSNLFVTANSSNPTLVNISTIRFEGTGENRVISITPTHNKTGTAIISVSVSDGELTATKAFNLTVIGVNDAPVISKIANQTINEDTALTQISFTVSDIENSVLMVSGNSSNLTLVSSIILEGTGENRTISLTPTSNENGTAIISLSVTDGELTATTSFALTVNAVNDIPVISSIADQTIDEDSSLTQIHFTVADIDSSNLMVSGNSSNPTLVNNTSIIITGDMLSLTPTANENGVAIISLSVTDGELTATTSFMLTVTSINDAPVISSVSDQTIQEDTELQVAFDVSDIETPDAELILSAISSNTVLVGPGTIKLMGTGSGRTLSLTPTLNESGTTEIILSLTDGDLTATTSFQLTVTEINDRPMISTIPDYTIDEDSGLTQVVFSIEDIESGMLTIRAVSSNLSLVSSNSFEFGVNHSNDYTINVGRSQSKLITMTVNPLANEFGSTTITVIVEDSASNHLSACTSFALTVNAINDVPVFTAKDVSIYEDSGTQTIVNWADISPGADNEINDQLTFIITSTHDKLLTAEPSVSISGTSGNLHFNPLPNCFGATVVTLYLEDDGAVHNTSLTQSFTISITPVNDPPTFTKGDNQLVEANHGAPQIVQGWATNISKGPSNESDQELTFHAIADNYSLFASGPFIQSNGTLTYTPTSNANGVATVHVYLTDNGGGNYTSTVQTFTITLETVNQAPSFTKGNNVTIDEDSGLNIIQAWASNINPGAENETNQRLMFKVSTNNPGLFTSTPSISYTTGDLVIVPARNQNGTATVSVILKDNGGIANGGQDTFTTQTFTITVRPVNDRPSFTKGGNLIVKQGITKEISNWATNISSGPADESSQQLTFTAEPDQLTLFERYPQITSDGTLNFKAVSSQYTGTAIISVYLSDNGGQYSKSTVQYFTITVTDSAPPVISEIDDMEIAQNKRTEPTYFTISDTETPANRLMFTVFSSNTDLVPHENIFIAGSDENRSVSIEPETDQSGVLDISITVYDASGKTANETFALTIHARPAASIGLVSGYSTTGTVPLAVAFTPINAQNIITKWYWDFGDHTVSTLQSPVHTYVFDGSEIIKSFTVSLVVSGPGGTYTETKSDYITIKRPAYVDFVATGSRTGQSPLSVSFENQSEIENATDYFWDFGDGTHTTGKTPTHIYTSAGIYAVTLTVFDNENTKYHRVKPDYVIVKGRSISGHVTASDTGAGIHNCLVEVWSGHSYYEGSDLTDSNGSYTITGLPLMDNLIVVAWPIFADDTYFTQYYANKDRSEQANRISIVSGNAYDIDFKLKNVSENGIRGQILNQDKINGIPDAAVYVFSMTDGFGKGVTADNNGFYTITGLKASNDYIVSVWSDTYETEYFYNENETVSTLDQATRIIVADSVVEGITLVIAQKGRISGYVRSNGKAVENVWVNAWSNYLSTGNGALTDENGRYTISALTSESNGIAISYAVEILSVGHPYQAYSMATHRANATPVTCDAFQINFDLPTGYDITGRVISANNEKLAGVNISAWSKNGNGNGSAFTDESGFYTITDLPIESDYILGAFADDYPVQFFHLKEKQQQADLIDMNNGTYHNANFVLDKGFVIKGLIRLENQQTPAGSGINVNIWSESTSTGGDVITDSSGMYEISGLDGNASDYIISVFYQDYMPAYYNEDATVYQRQNAQCVSPSENYRNIVLISGYVIKGKVTAGNEPVSGIKVEAISTESGGWGVAVTGKNLVNDSNYEISGLPPGNYQISIYPNNYVDQSITKQINSDTIGVNFVLQEPDRKISGTVAGLISGKSASINVWSPSKKITKTISLSGTGEKIYEITGLKPASDYLVECRSTYYPYIIYNNASSLDDATNIDLSTNDQTGIDFNLSIPTVSISGSVSFPSGAVTGEMAWVDVISNSSLPGGGVWIAGNGEGNILYEILGLKQGQYYVSVTSDHYKTQYFNQVSTFNKAQIVDARQISQTDIDFTLSKGAIISGKVLNNDGQTGAVNIHVEAMSDITGYWGGATTDNIGSYAIKGLENASDYKVKAEVPGKGSYYYNADIAGTTVRNISLATPVKVTDGNPVSGINMQLSQGYSISGIVRNQNNQALSGIFMIAESDITKAGNSTFTGNDGKYTIGGLPQGQDYIVSAIPEGSNYLSQSKENISTNTVGIDFSLSTGYSVKGVVTSESSGTPISRVEIMLISLNTPSWARTNRLGQYILTGIRASNDYVLTAKPSSQSSYLSSSIDLIVNSDVIQNFVLQSAFSISGHVKDSNNVPLSGVVITAFSACKNYVATAISKDDGTYVIENVPDASDYLMTAKLDNYAAKEKYDQAPGTGIDFILETGGSISGFVITESGAFKGASIEISSESLSSFANTTTDSTGYYEISGLQAMKGGEIVCDYVVSVNAVGYPQQTIAQKKVNDKVNFVLKRGAENEISGTVRDSLGNLLPSGGKNVFAIAYDISHKLVEKVKVLQDGSGSFTFTKLDSLGSYRLYFRVYRCNGWAY